MIYAILAVCTAAFLYQLTALAACLRHLVARDPEGSWTPPVSLLKPVRGLDQGFFEAIQSHAVQDYPDFEMLFGVTDPDDPSIAEVERLARQFPGLDVRWLPSFREALNRKVGVLADLAAEARHPVLLVNDSDIAVPAGYLKKVVAPLENPGNGLVTCLYRGRAGSLPGRWEAFGLAVDFAPSALVAPLVGVREFGLGATLVFRAADLEKIGGFESVADYLADDYQLSKRLTSLGLKAVMSRVVVETNLGDDTWAGVWGHQVRWARTIRVSRPAGYAGLPIAHAGVWALAAGLAGAWWAAAALIAARVLMAFVGGVLVLGCRYASRAFFLAPLWDFWALAVWVAGLAGDTVVWRGRRLRVGREGRILQE